MYINAADVIFYNIVLLVCKVGGTVELQRASYVSWQNCDTQTDTIVPCLDRN